MGIMRTMRLKLLSMPEKRPSVMVGIDEMTVASFFHRGFDLLTPLSRDRRMHGQKHQIGHLCDGPICVSFDQAIVNDGR